MNEKRWLAAKDARPMLEYLGKKDQWMDRKVRLFAAACCRRLARLMPGKSIRDAVETAERFADGAVTAKKLQTACERAWAAQSGPFPEDERAELGAYASAAESVYLLCEPRDDMDICAILDAIYQASVCDPDDPEEEDGFQVALVREVYGNPFRPVAFASEWRTDTAVSLARTMYESRDFSAMPILADALQDAGCDNDDVLTHCRDVNQVHVRGCWVVDSVLERS